jgi:dipeptidyl aminopeptidase/acylaminoacyl peptidase
VTVFELSASADGKRIAPVINKRLYDVYVGEIGSDPSLRNSLRRLTWDERNDSPSDWTPDGTAVLFQSNRSGNWDIYKQAPGERRAIPLVAGPADETNPVVSPDGKHLLYKSRVFGADPEASVMRVSLSGGPTSRVMDLRNNGALFRCASRGDGPCVVSEPHEEGLLFATFDPVRGRRSDIVTVDSAERPVWNEGWDLSPDGSRIAILPTDRAVHGLATYRDAIRIIPVGGGPSTDIPLPSTLGNYTVSWAADGRSLFVSGSRSEPGDWVIVRADTSGHTEILLSGESAFHLARPSPDGKHLALRKSGWETNVWLLEGF